MRRLFIFILLRLMQSWRTGTGQKGKKHRIWKEQDNHLDEYLHEWLGKLMWISHSITACYMNRKYSWNLRSIFWLLEYCFGPQFFYFLIVFGSTKINNTSFRLYGRQSEPFSYKTVCALIYFLSSLGFCCAAWKLLFSSVQAWHRTWSYMASQSP